MNKRGMDSGAAESPAPAASLPAGVRPEARPPARSRWRTLVQVVLVLVLALGVMFGVGGLPTQVRSTLLEQFRVIEGSFAPRQRATGYGRSETDTPLAPVRINVTPTVIRVPPE